jgi:hypothetical protein
VIADIPEKSATTMQKYNKKQHGLPNFWKNLISLPFFPPPSRP